MKNAAPLTRPARRGAPGAVGTKGVPAILRAASNKGLEQGRGGAARIMADARRTKRALAGNIDDCIWWLTRFGGPAWSVEDYRKEVLP